jgi:uncharacterized protein
MVRRILLVLARALPLLLPRTASPRTARTASPRTDRLAPPACRLVGSAGERTLQQRYGTGDRARRFYDTQLLDHLNDAMRAFVTRQEFMFLATSDARGNCDNTFRAGPPGFVHVLDDHRLAWPEYRGNGVLASLGNISENPRVGLLFLDFGADGVGLHVNGAATIVDDAELRADHPDLPVEAAPNRRAARWVVADVHEAYIHCSKFIPRLGPDGNAPRRGRSDYFVHPGTTSR